MKIVIGSDHAGTSYRQKLTEHLEEKGMSVMQIEDVDSVTDYPIIGEAVALEVSQNRADLGIVICGTGIGISMSAGKVPGTRVALCFDEFMAKMAKNHNHANILAFGARVIACEKMLRCVDTFLSEEKEGGRHANRVAMMDDIDKKYRK